MKKIMKYILWFVVASIIIAIFVLSLYRVVFFPEQTRLSCDEFARNAVSKITGATSRSEYIKEREDIYNYYYNSCFRQAGLKPEIK